MKKLFAFLITLALAASLGFPQGKILGGKVLGGKVVGSGAAFSPADLSELTLWLKADAIVGLANNDPVTTWEDSSASNYDAVGSGTTRPLYITNCQNSLPCVRFDGTDDFLQIANAALDSYFSLFVAATCTTAKPMFIEQSIHAASNEGFYFYGTQNESWNINRGVSVHSAFGVSSWMGSAATHVSLIYNGTGAYYKGGIVQANNTVTGTDVGDSSATDTLNLFSRNGTGVFSQCDVFEIALYENAKGTTDRQSFETYIARWGL